MLLLTVIDEALFPISLKPSFWLEKCAICDPSLSREYNEDWQSVIAVTRIVLMCIVLRSDTCDLYNYMIDAKSQTGAFGLWDLMITQGRVPNELTYTDVIHGFMQKPGL
ncbi:hypothetical protein DY000_02001055 [Brassica cretica]|uniref:Pentatricopeptide repeat-containing protein n=1 Tax=Brassica cretica TaxID=69181 RepID=A0ABQ7BRB3_BRACR|nr:hypothetical protein DY000_02001055 [Brassica cretica]